MKKFTFAALVSFSFILLASIAYGQKGPLKPFIKPNPKGTIRQLPPRRCSTMEELQKAIANDPSLPGKWKVTGDSLYQLYLDRVHSGERVTGTADNPIIIPIVFHLVDNATHLSWISDRDIEEQVEILNEDYAGKKADKYAGVIPAEAYSRVGHVNIKFVLARRDPSGNLTTGIERRVNATPDHVSIKANSTGGLDAWDVNKYLNVWCGTFSGGDAGLLGISTFPFTTGQGPHGVVIGLITLPFADLNAPRASSSSEASYYPDYAEGSTLSHEIGHFFYLFHTFGDNPACNNDDFDIQPGWPLAPGAGPEGDDTPMQKGTGASSFVYGNPSMDYNVGCETNSFGILYGTYMNYFDDRALFMFSDGERKRVESCLAMYRSGLITSDGATPPSAVTDAYLVNVSSRGYIDRRTFLTNNTPFSAIVRNSGTTTLTSVTVNVGIDGGAATPTVFPLSLAPGRDTTLDLAPISGTTGNHTYRVYTTAPNGTTDDFLTNDTLSSIVNIVGATATLPLTESFTSATFPPANWLLWNPNGSTWTRSATSGYTDPGAAFFDNYNINNIGTLDDLVTPAIDLAGTPGALLTFKLANAAYDGADVSTWDGLEVYVSGDGGKTYSLAYKKSGTSLATSPVQTSAFTATPAEPSKWRTEIVNLTPYIVPGQKMLIRFRNDNAYGNNTYIDDISIVGNSGVGTNDAEITSISNPANGSTIPCPPVTPTVTITNAGTNTLTTALISVQLNGTFVYSQPWTGSLVTGASATLTLGTALNVTTIGTNTLKIFTSIPNGQIDADPTNDTTTSVFTRIGPSTLPVVNSFETAFLPAGWAIANPDADNTWIWNTPGAGGSTRSASIDNYNNNVRGHADDIRTPVINTSALLANDSVYFSFDLAHANFPLAGFADSLKVLISNDCGTSFTTLWAKVDPNLATTAANLNEYSSPAAGDWKNQRISIGNNLFGTGQIQFALVNVNGFGNVLWVDNINVSKKPRKDLQTSAIVRPALTECTTFAPSITVKNAGEATITGFKTGYILNNGTPVIQAQNITLAAGASTTITFTITTTPPVGNNTIKLFVADGLTALLGPDLNPANDTLVRTFTVPVTAANVVEGFEGTFPPTNWFLINPDNSFTWEKTPSGRLSNNSAYVDNYDYATGTYLFDYLQTPLINTNGADSLIITFDVAHKVYEDPSGTSVDNLSVLLSRNCGSTFTTVYSKTGTDLATAGSAGTDPYLNPAQSDWRRERVVYNLIANPASSVIAQFRNGDAYGNNVYIDNINIIPKFKRDIEVLSVTPEAACSGTAYAPVIQVHNRGTETVTAFTIAYTIGTGTPATQSVTGITLAPDATTNVTLATGTLAAGANNIKVYTSAPTAASGTGDQYLLNDTLTRVIYSSGVVTAPANIVETFEGNFLPTGWALSNPDNSLTWQKAAAGNNSNASAFIRNFAYLSTGQKDGLYTPVLNFTGVDSVKVSFDVSAANKDFPGVTSTGLDTLEVLATKDCGNTFTSVYKKWGSQLQTIGDPNYPQTQEYIPSASNQWRTEYIDLTSFAPSGSVQLVFRNTNNNQNNIYIDNVNFRTVTLPARLKSEGAIVIPNPFGEQFNVWFVRAPSDLRYLNVYNAIGQLIVKKEYGNGSTSNVINVNMVGLPAGVYILKLGFSDKSNDKEIRIFKSN